jgi:hypothetical protein
MIYYFEIMYDELSQLEAEYNIFEIIIDTINIMTSDIFHL